VLSLWRRFRDLSIPAYEKIYRRLNIRFDVYGGESLVRADNMRKCLETLEEKGFRVEKTVNESRRDINYKAAAKEIPEEEADPNAPAAFAVDLAAYKLGKPVVQKGGALLQDSLFRRISRLILPICWACTLDGTSTYLTRDIAGAIQRFETYKFDKMVMVISDEQDFYMQQFFKLLQLMGLPFSDRLEHINFGRVLGMSTRKGEVKFLDDILDTSKATMREQILKNEEKANDIPNLDYTSDEIGMTCVKIQDMQSRR
jgi:arginyl-tRNA synthetase